MTTEPHGAGTAVPARARWTLVSAHLSFFLVLNGSTAPNVALLPIQRQFGNDPADLSWVLNAYALAFASTLLLAGASSDRFGARRVFLAGLWIFSLASAACLLVPSLAALIAGQAVSGLGAAALAATSLVLISHACPDPIKRARAVAAWAATGAVAVAAGPLIGGILVSQFGWRAIFLLNAAGGVVVLAIAVWRVAAAPKAPQRGFDPAGQLLAIVALCALTVALVAVSKGGWSSWVTIGGLLLAVLAAGAFVLVERTVRSPLFPVELIRKPTFSAALGVGLLLNLAYYGQVFVLALYFGSVAGYSPMRIGLALLPMTAVLSVSNVIVGRLISRTGGRLLMWIGNLVCGLGLLLLALLGPGAPYRVLWLPLLIIGVGSGFVVPTMTTVLLSTVSAPHVGIASGMLNTSRQVGGVIGVALFGSLVTGLEFLHGVRVSQLLAAGAVLLAALLSAQFVSHPPTGFDRDVTARN